MKLFPSLVLTLVGVASGKASMRHAVNVPQTVGQSARPAVLSKTLILRGGISSAETGVGANLAVAATYGLGMIFKTNTLLATYDLPPQDFLSPTIGAFQYLGAHPNAQPSPRHCSSLSPHGCIRPRPAPTGGMYLMVALRCYASLVGARDPSQTLEALTYMNLTLLAIAVYRTQQGSAPSKKNVVLFATLAATSYFCGGKGQGWLP
jgi:hypothetical protein